MERETLEIPTLSRRDGSPRSQVYLSSDSPPAGLVQGQRRWTSSVVAGRDISPRNHGHRSPETQTPGTAEELLHTGRLTHDQGVLARQSSIVDQRDGSTRSQGYRTPDRRPTGMTQSLHINERSTHSQNTANFELEPVGRPSELVRRRRNRKPPKDEEKGGQELNNDEYFNRLVADRGTQSSLQAYRPPLNSRIVPVSEPAAKDSYNEARFGGRWTHIEGEGMSLQEFKARVMQVLYNPIAT